MDGIAVVIACLLCVVLVDNDRIVQAQTTTSITDCTSPWNVTVTEDIAVMWSGDNRVADIRVVIVNLQSTTEKCLKTLNVVTTFDVWEIVPPKAACKGMTYEVNVTLICNDMNVNTYSIVVSTPSVPSAPRNISAVTDSISATLSWEEPEPFVGPILFFKMELADKRSIIMRKDIYDGLSYVVENLTPITDYYVKLAAATKAGTGKWSQYLAFQTQRPLPPEHLNITSVTSSSVSLAWNEPTLYKGKRLITHYSIRWYALYSEKNQTKDTKDQEYTFENLDPFTDYSIIVCSWSENGASNWTPRLFFQTDVGVPYPPQNLSEVSVTNTSIRVEWTKPFPNTGPIDLYTLQWFEAGTSELMWNSTLLTRHEIQELTPCRKYFIKVRATTKQGTGNWSDAISVLTKPGIPFRPRNITFTTIKQTMVELQWKIPKPYRGPILSYSIQWIEANGEVKNTSLTNETVFIIRNLLPYTLYLIQVRAETEAGEGEWSDVEQVRTAIGIPSVPRNVTVKSKISSSIKIQWEEPLASNGPIISYSVRWRKTKNTDDVSNWTVQDRLQPEDLSFLIVNLSAFTNYSIQVLATTKAGSGDWSDAIVVQTDVGVPFKPSELLVQKITDTSIELEWKEPETSVGDIIYYDVQWTNSQTRNRQVVRSTKLYYKIKNLQSYTNYTFKVRGATTAGPGEWSDTKEVRTKSGVPKPPKNLQLVEKTNLTIEFQWDEPSPFEGPIVMYTVQWIHSESLSFSEDYTRSTHFQIKNLEPYTFYNITVMAMTESGNGPFSDILGIQTAIGIPTAPRNVTLVSKTAWNIQLSWSAPFKVNGPIIKYQVAWGARGLNIINSFTNQTYFDVEDLIPYTAYLFQVSAATEVGYGPQSDLFVTRTDIAVPSEPTNLVLESSTNTSLALKWKPPNQPNGPLLDYAIQWTNDEDNVTESRVVASASCAIPDLDPYTNYSIQVAARTEAGLGSWSIILMAMTKVGVPRPAQLLSISPDSSRSVVVEWSTLKPYPGPTKYTIELWRKPGVCEEIKIDFITSTLKGNRERDEWMNRRQDAFGNLTPYTQYYIRLLLETSTGKCESNMSYSVRTYPETPSSPNDVEANCQDSSTEAEVRWKPPTQPNGKIVMYHIKYGVEHAGWNEVTVPATTQCGGQNVTLVDLRPEKRYNIIVQAKVEGISSTGKENAIEDYCVLPAGVPPIGNEQYVEMKDSGPEYLIFEWSQDVFSDDMGALVNYAVIVGELEAVGNATRGQLADISPNWYNFSNGISDTYQATPMEWNPFVKGGDDPLQCVEIVREESSVIQSTLKCTLGADILSCSSSELYCNGPLTPETTYGIKLRAFTRGGFAETGPIFATTGSIPSSSSLVGGIVAMFMILLIAGGFATAFLFFKRKGKLEELRRIIVSRLRRHESESPPVAVQQDIQLETCPTKIPLTIQNFHEHVRFLMSDSHLRFSQEFEALKQDSPKFPCSAAEMEENRTKNRWLNIFPYDHSRVKLLPLGDDTSSDFVNANFIPGFSSLREYIASQGPTASTLEDFWRMIWEQSVTMIVMLTQCIERGKNKCEQYWPDSGEAKHYGDVLVRSVSESMLSSYAIRMFTLQLGSQERKVKQMHFTHWPDFGCPESPGDLINFMRAVRDHLPRIRPGPILVHCSAGVGRTGTFITVDRLSQQIRHTDNNIDIYGTVMELRHHRINMVQTEDQYIYIHLCVCQLIDEINDPSESEYEEAIYSNIGKVTSTKV